jgi:hypothetical protein
LEWSILRCASFLTPGQDRADWLREWRSELWHARATMRLSDGDTWKTEEAMLQFCAGAIQDAVALRRIEWEKTGARGSLRGSATGCLLFLCALLGASYLVSLLLPGVRAQNHPSLYKVNSDLILIQNAFASNDSLATIPIEQYRAWKAGKQRYFDGFAFYRLAKESVTTPVSANQRWLVAHGSMNLFWMLGLPMRFSAANGESEGRLPGVILSNEVWDREYAADPLIGGRLVQIGSVTARVIGVAPGGAWRMPGNVDAWFLEPDKANSGVGFVIAHLTELGKSAMTSSRVEITSVGNDDPDEQLYAVSFAERTKGPWRLYEFTILLALLTLPAVTSVSLSESNFCSYRPSWSNRMWRWMFLCAKILLVLPIVYFASLDIAYCHTAAYSVGAQYAQLIASFMMGLFGMRWIVLDQRNRCPVCLRCVTHPAQVGMAGRTFLAWNGTELMCAGGHTLLHVPALPTSWFGTQRWLYLDTSWRFLFASSSAS